MIFQDTSVFAEVSFLLFRKGRADLQFVRAMGLFDKKLVGNMYVVTKNSKFGNNFELLLDLWIEK